MNAKTETDLAERLGCTRATLYQWRRDHTDAPAGRDVHEWKNFMQAHQLGTKSLAAGRYSPRSEAEKLVMHAEAVLWTANDVVAKISADKAREFLEQRRKISVLIDPLYRIIG